MLKSDQAEANAYCATALQAWHDVALTAQKLTLIKTCIEIINVPMKTYSKTTKIKSSEAPSSQ